MIAAGTVVPKPKLKIKFPSQRIEVIHVPQSFELGQHLSSFLDGKKTSFAGNSKMASGSRKRGPEGLILERPLEKKRKMDRSLTQQCSSLLKALMKHPFSWVFSKPVDPVQLKIPDYFLIIKNPMDLGTIKCKLEKNAYQGIEEFEADVKLTFSNAMLYNPPSNDVHRFALELNEIFESRWKSLEEKLIRDKAGHGKILSVRLKDVDVPKQICPKIHLSGNSSLAKKSKASEQKIVKMPLDARATKIELPKSAHKCESKLAIRNFQKVGSYCGGRADGSVVNAKPPLSLDACKCSSCGSINCQCILPSDSNQASSSDLTSDRSLGGDLRVCSADAFKLDYQAKSTLSSQMSKSDPDSDGAVSALDDEHVCPSSQIRAPATDADSAEGLLSPCFDAQMSPKKALRAAMLRTRFADTILKAQQKTLLEHADTSDPVKMQLEKEKLERRQREEKAKIEAQIRAAEAAARMKAETERKRQQQERERERKAARLSLEKMVKTAEIEQNLKIFKELEMLSGGSLNYNPHCKHGCEKVTGRGLCSRSCRNPLHQLLGLFLKLEYLADEDEEAVLNEGGEEGEILS